VLQATSHVPCHTNENRQLIDQVDGAMITLAKAYSVRSKPPRDKPLAKPSVNI
jgi:hypothetical protein